MQQTAADCQDVTRTTTLAQRADRHRLYELSVQCPEAEADFLDQCYLGLRGRMPARLREDFCGTAALCREWVGRRETNQAVGVDLDPEVLRWARRANREGLEPSAVARLELVEGDVTRTDSEPADIVVAMNFSYWLLCERAALRRYFEQVRRSLKDDGIFFLDAYGGYDSYRVTAEEREIPDEATSFTYVWEQASFDPITSGMLCHIHFRFPDGSRLERAFSYQWRLWTLPEIRELLQEAGFRRTRVYWQGWDANGEPDGVFKPVESGEPDAGWICYLGAER